MLAILILSARIELGQEREQFGCRAAIDINDARRFGKQVVIGELIER